MKWSQVHKLAVLALLANDMEMAKKWLEQLVGISSRALANHPDERLFELAKAAYEESISFLNRPDLTKEQVKELADSMIAFATLMDMYAMLDDIKIVVIDARKAVAQQDPSRN